MAGTALFGGMFVMAAWLDVVRKRATTADWRIPTSLYPFTVSVILHPIAFIWLSSLPDGHQHVILTNSVMLFAIAGSFASLLVTMVLVRQNSGPGTGIVAIGSKILLVLALVGFVGIIVGLPGEIETWHA